MKLENKCDLIDDEVNERRTIPDCRLHRALFLFQYQFAKDLF